MKTTSILIIGILLFQSAFCAQSSTDQQQNSHQLVIVEMEGFGREGQDGWNRFVKGMQRAFEEAHLPYELKFERSPIKNYEGNQAIELRLKYWDFHSPKAILRCWVRFVDPAGEKSKWEVFESEYKTWGFTDELIEKHSKEHAYLASKKLVELLKTHW